MARNTGPLCPRLRLSPKLSIWPSRLRDAFEERKATWLQFSFGEFSFSEESYSEAVDLRDLIRVLIYGLDGPGTNCTGVHKEGAPEPNQPWLKGKRIRSGQQE
jgi:hypothetical protein